MNIALKCSKLHQFSKQLKLIWVRPNTSEFLSMHLSVNVVPPKETLPQ